MRAEEVKELLLKHFPQAAERVSVEGDRCFLQCGPATLVETAAALKHLPEVPFTYFSFMTAIDRKDRFDALYCLSNLEHAATVFLRTAVAREGESLPSLTAVYRGADWHEREAFDMFGLQFTGHPHLVRLLLPEEFEGHPLRKDFNVLEQAPKFRRMRAQPGSGERAEASEGGG